MAMYLAAAMLLWSLTGCSASGGFDWSMLSTTPAPNAQEERQQAQRNSLTLAMPVHSGVFDPLRNASLQMQELFSLVFEGLFRVGDQGKLEPWLAETMQKTDTGWQITLRSGVQFHDGTVLSAQDVVNAFETIREIGQEGPYAYCLEDIQGMRTLDNRTLEVESSVGYEALYRLCFPVARYPETDGLAMGSGPYRVDSYLTGAALELVRSENWWRKAPVLESLEAVALEGEMTAELVQVGEVDVAQVEQMMASSLYNYSKVGTQDYPTGRVELLVPNLGGALQDIRLRRAISLLLDRRDIITNAYRSHGVAVEVPVWPDSFLSEQVEASAFDPEEAKKLLKELGWEDADGDGLLERAGTQFLEEAPTLQPNPSPAPENTSETRDEEADGEGVTVDELLGNPQTEENGPERLRLTLLVCADDNAAGTDAARCLETQFMAAGIELTTESLPFEMLLQRMRDGEYDLALIGYQLGASADLTPLLSSSGANNLMGYASPAMDLCLKNLMNAQSLEEYQVEAQRMYARIQQDLPVFSLLMRAKTRVTAAGLQATGSVREGDSFRGIENWTFE